MRNERWIVPFLLAAAVAACDSVPTPPEAVGEESWIPQAIEARGLSSEGWKEWGDYVVAEGDVLLRKSALASAPRRGSGPLRPMFQFRTAQLVGSPRIHQLRVDLSQMGAEPHWADAARAAMAEWSAIQGSYIRMVEGSPGDITVQLQCFPPDDNGGIAKAEFPSGGGPGAVIVLNTCQRADLEYRWEEKISIMLHNLGHTIGFQHTDWLQNDEPEPLHVYGTPYSGGDDASVMNARLEDRHLSAYDRKAAQTMYPLPPPVVTVVNDGGHPRVTWTYPFGATGAFAVRLLHNRYERAGRLPPETINEEWVLGSGSGLVTLHDTQRSWTGTSSCSVMTTTYTRKEAWLYEVVIQYPNGGSLATASAPVGSC
ncbi:M57 family metalloprotease [Longimicrobium sp.]|uniref:M57 family metalloprotease n=1 Tax=Longimicrobium sp. TaxID=2029185 RepID=UPI003B3A1921